MAVTTYGKRYLSGAVTGATSIDVDSYVRGTPVLTDSATSAIEYRGMAAYASATGANRVPGDVWLAGLAPTNGGTTYGKAGIKVGATEFCWVTNDAGTRKLVFQSGAFISDNFAYLGLLFQGNGTSIRFDGTSTEFGDGAGGLSAVLYNGYLSLYNNWVMNFHGAVEQSTVGAAGGASALPATPSGYLRVAIDDVEYVVPYYAKT